MMNDLVKIKNEGYSEYEDLLLRRDKLRKEAQIWQSQYMAEFGDLIAAIFEKKIECIKKKKTISFCLIAINKGISVNQAALQNYLKKEMREYNRQLKQMIAENEAAHNMDTVSDADLAKIKKLYRRLAKMIHPDINFKTSESAELQNLWQMIVVSYNANNLDGLKEAEILVNKVLRNIGVDSIEVEIPDIPEKMKQIEDEITRIKITIPYQYKYLLQDANAVKEKRGALAVELKKYEDYTKELDQFIDQLTKGGGHFRWQVN
jgi:hypothetical protein